MNKNKKIIKITGHILRYSPPRPKYLYSTISGNTENIRDAFIFKSKKELKEFADRHGYSDYTIQKATTIIEG